MFGKGFKKVKSSNINLVEGGNICKKKLRNTISNVISGRATYINEEDIGCKDVANLWNEMIDNICEEKRQNAMQINELLKYITEMEFVKEMIDDVRVQTSTFHNIAASSEEMSASIDDVANFIENVADTTSDTQKLAIKGEENINEAFSFVNKSFQDIDEINKQMKDVMGKAEKINQIVDIVKGIAEQTNLLALNAAIEAARAGEQGRGFAVVADEVRKLAEHTKDSVSSIQQNINELKCGIENSVTKADETSSRLESGKSLVDNALVSISSIIGRIKEVNDNVMQISANVEEQTAATTEIAKEMNNLNELTNNLLNECDKTGRAIYDVSSQVNDIRLSTLKGHLCLDDKELLDVCTTDHLIWKWRVYNMILGYDKIDINTIGTHKECRLGKWYYGDNSESFKNHKMFINLEKPHIRIHELAKEATIAYSKNDIAKAEKALEEMKKYSEIVIEALNDLKEL